MICAFDSSGKCVRCGYITKRSALIRRCAPPPARSPIVSPQSEPPPPLAREADSVSWLTKAKNFAVATAQHVASGMPTASDEEILRRHAICTACEFFVNDSCGQCGCPVYRDRKFVSKLAWADQSCPVGKWGPVEASA